MADCSSLKHAKVSYSITPVLPHAFLPPEPGSQGGSSLLRKMHDKVSITHGDMPLHFGDGTSQCCINQQQHILAKLHNLVERALAHLDASFHAQPAHTSTASQIQQQGRIRPLTLASLSLSSTAKAGLRTTQETPVQPVTNVECPFKSGQQLHGSSYTLLQQAADMSSSWLWLAKSNRPSTNQTVLIKICKDAGPAGYAAGCRERDMTLAVQPLSQGSDEIHFRQPTAGETLNQEGSSTTDCASTPVVPYIGWFSHQGNKGGQHSCLVVELLGSNLEHVCSRYGQGLLAALGVAAQQEQQGKGTAFVDGSMPARMGLPLPVVRRMSRRLLRALQYVHSQGIVHRAVYPEHVLLPGIFTPWTPESAQPTAPGLLQFTESLRKAWQSFTATLLRSNGTTQGATLTPQDVQLPVLTEENVAKQPLFLADFGNARPALNASVPLPGDEPILLGGHHPAFRPPEELIGAGCSPAYDIWQAGCLVWYLATGNHLFNDDYQQPQSMLEMTVAEQQQQGGMRDGGEGFGSKLTPIEQHLAAMVCNLGPFPTKMVENSLLRQVYFRRSGRLRLEADYHLQRDPLDQVLQREYGWEGKEAQALAAFLTPMLKLDPSDRATASDMLNHPWLTRQTRANQSAPVRKRQELLQSFLEPIADTESEAYDSDLAEELLTSLMPTDRKKD